MARGRISGERVFLGVVISEKTGLGKLLEEIKIIVRSFGSSKNTKLEDGPAVP